MKKLFAMFLAMLMLLSCSFALADKLVYEEDFPVGSVIGDGMSVSPALAPRGEYAIGVRTIDIVSPDRVDLAAITDENPMPTYDRVLTCEIWYPCVVEEGVKQISTYTDHMGQVNYDNLLPVDFVGRAVRDAEPYTADGAFPVIVVTHGYPGSRYLMSNLGENLATKGYVVISIGHTDTTYTDFNPDISLISAIANRSLDQRAVISAIDELNAEGWAAGMLDSEHVGVIGYSFGGYGLLRTLGVKLNEGTLAAYEKYAEILKDPEEYVGDKRVDAAVLFAPYGAAMFDAESFNNIDVPTLWLSGNVDVTVPYSSVQDMFGKSVNSERFMVTYKLMSHKVAPNPAPIISQGFSYSSGSRRWADTVWDQWTVNGINFHFITAFMDAKLKGNADMMQYLDVAETDGANCVYNIGSDGVAAENHTYWPGFQKETSVGLMLEKGIMG